MNRQQFGGERRGPRRTWRRGYVALLAAGLMTPWYAVPLAERLGISVWVEALVIIAILAVLALAVRLAPSGDDRA